MSAKISIPGGNGRMGKTLIKEIIENENLELANSYCLPNEKENGLDLGTLVGHNPIDKILTDNFSSIFEDTDVIIDFTVPEASILHVEKAVYDNDIGRSKSGLTTILDVHRNCHRNSNSWQ